MISWTGEDQAQLELYFRLMQETEGRCAETVPAHMYDAALAAYRRLDEECRELHRSLRQARECIQADNRQWWIALGMSGLSVLGWAVALFALLARVR